MCITHICHNFNSVITVYREKNLLLEIMNIEYEIINEIKH
jgi:hypothetical protein